MVEFAQQYAIRNGPDDAAFKMYFGEEKENYAKVLGVYESILYSDKTNVVFRCDNPDGVSSDSTLLALHNPQHCSGRCKGGRSDS